jgi:hypothetical protein
MKADAITARLAAGHNGNLTVQLLQQAGVSRQERRTLLAHGVLLATGPGQLRHRAVPVTWMGQVERAVLAAGGDAVASHRTAARLHGFDRVPRHRPEVTTTALDLPRQSGVHVHRTTLLDAIDRTTVEGIRSTARPRTLLDLAGTMPFELVQHIVEDAVIRKFVTHPQLFSVLERVGGRGRPGSANLRAVLRSGLPDERVTTKLEHLLHVLIESLPVPAPVLQMPFTCVDGRNVRFDFAWPTGRIAVEPDGHRWHATSAQLRSDLARRRSIALSGWTLYSYGWADVVESVLRTRDELCRVLVA